MVRVEVTDGAIALAEDRKLTELRLRSVQPDDEICYFLANRRWARGLHMGFGSPTKQNFVRY